MFEPTNEVVNIVLCSDRNRPCFQRFLLEHIGVYCNILNILNIKLKENRQ